MVEQNQLDTHSVMSEAISKDERISQVPSRSDTISLTRSKKKKRPPRQHSNQTPSPEEIRQLESHFLSKIRIQKQITTLFSLKK